jgi:hypothetical protein
MNRRTGRVEFAAERITSTVLSVISLGVGVSRSADILEILFRQGRFVGRKRSSRSCAAGAKEKNGDESRENGQGEATKFSVGQGGSPAKLLTLIHNRARRFFHDKIRGNHFNRQAESLNEPKTHQIRRTDRCDSTFGNGVVCLLRPRHTRGRTLARRMRFFGTRATADLRRRPPQFKIHFVPDPIARLLFAIAALLFLPFTLWKSAHERLTDIDVIAHKLEQEASPSDLIVVNPWHFAPSFYRYYHGSTPWITVPTMSEHRIHRYDLMKSKMIELDPLSDVRSAIRQTLQSSHRVWVVGGARPFDENMPHLGASPQSVLRLGRLYGVLVDGTWFFS